jgi:hypothetical protein
MTLLRGTVQHISNYRNQLRLHVPMYLLTIDHVSTILE